MNYKDLLCMTKQAPQLTSIMNYHLSKKYNVGKHEKQVC